MNLKPLFVQTEFKLNDKLKGGEGTFLKTDTLTDATSVGELFARFASTIFGFLTLLAGLAFLLYFALGAIKWITSGGDTNQVEAARNQMTAAAIGLVAIIAAYTVAGIVSLTLGIDILNPAKALQSIVP